MMRFMGLDVGDKRIGVALSDDGAAIATPIETIHRSGNRKDVTKLLELARDRDVSGIVVGIPYLADGSEGRQAEKIRGFIAAVEAQTELPIATWDERYTSADAEDLLREAAVSSRRRRKGAVDRIAAALILQGYLDARRAD